MKYATVCGDGVENLTIRVNRAIAAGWEPVGGIFVLNGGGIQELYQSLVRKSPAETVDCEDEEDDAPHVRRISLLDEIEESETCVYHVLDKNNCWIGPEFTSWEDAASFAKKQHDKTGYPYRINLVKVVDMTPDYLKKISKSEELAGVIEKWINTDARMRGNIILDNLELCEEFIAEQRSKKS